MAQPCQPMYTSTTAEKAMRASTFRLVGFARSGWQSLAALSTKTNTSSSRQYATTWTAPATYGAVRSGFVGQPMVCSGIQPASTAVSSQCTSDASASAARTMSCVQLLGAVKSPRSSTTSTTPNDSMLRPTAAARLPGWAHHDCLRQEYARLCECGWRATHAAASDQKAETRSSTTAEAIA